MRRLGSIAAALAALGSCPCVADEGVPLDPIVVTATRRESLDSQTPVSVSASGASQVGRGDLASIKDLAGTTPNVDFIEFSARAISNPQFRGVGGSTTNPGVTTYIDGVPQLSADTSSIELLDVSQIEFVRGAQGTLYGRNTLGGVINVMSRQPSGEWTVGGVSGIGSSGARLQKLGVSGPLFGDAAAFSVAAGYRSRDGFSENLQTGHRLDSRSATFGKAQLMTALGSLQLRAIAGVESAHDGDFALYDLAALRARPFEVRHDFEGFTRRLIQSQTVLGDWFGDRVRFHSVSGRVVYGAHEATDLDASEKPNLTRDNQRRGEQLTQELQWMSPDEAPWKPLPELSVSWVGGLFGFRQTNDQAVTNFISQAGLLDQAGTFLPPLPIGVSLPPLGTIAGGLPVPLPEVLRAEDRGSAHLRDLGAGAYFQGEAALFDHWRLAVGLRYDAERKRADLQSATVIVTPGGEVPQSGPTNVDQAHSYRSTSPAIRLSYHRDDWLAYASAGSGYRAGGFNPIAPAGQETYGEEHSVNFEAGVKAALWDERVRINLAIFRIDLTDLQLNVPVPNGAGRFYIQNAGDARNQGVELELRARPAAWLESYATLGLLSARFGAGSRNLGADVSGHRLPFADPLTATVGIVAGSGGWKLQPEVSRFGGYYYTANNDERLAPVTLVNLRGSYRIEGFELELWGRNLTDRSYIPLAIPYTGLAPSGFVGENAAARTFGIAVHYDLSS